MAQQTRRSSKSKTNTDGFYEMMPNAYMDSYELFPARRQTTIDELEQEVTEQNEEVVRKKMVRQLLMLVGLLLIQFVLFAILIQSTINLS